MFVCAHYISVHIGSWTRGGALLGSLTLYTRRDGHWHTVMSNGTKNLVQKSSTRTCALDFDLGVVRLGGFEHVEASALAIEKEEAGQVQALRRAVVGHAPVVYPGAHAQALTH